MSDTYEKKRNPNEQCPHHNMRQILTRVQKLKTCRGNRQREEEEEEREVECWPIFVNHYDECLNRQGMMRHITSDGSWDPSG
ncbi:hypothetical protein CARUB_v10010788mg [Capsella rubella]|uniref:Uncharacterized protein n=1 Tax=Capsella rubella TaxID=81985 RepID=R0IHN5_9BRAS|nr:hypothetical protein CARUB_v10010788mg [Capsella rubella]